MFIKTGVAAMLMALVASQSAAQDVNVGARVRITTKLGFRYQGQLTALDSATFTVSPDDSTPATPIVRSDVKKLEKSMGMREVMDPPTWAVVATWVGFGGGAVYGATGWGANARPKGVLGGLLGGLAGGVLAATLLHPEGERTKMEEQWKKVDLEPVVRPVITSDASGHLMLGMSIAIR